MKLEQRANKYAHSHGSNRAEHYHRTVGYIAGFREGVALSAGVALSKIRCDDRADRLQIANEVSEHIMNLADEPQSGAV